MANTYNVYLGVNNLAAVDFDTSVDTLTDAEYSDADINLSGAGILASTRYFLVIRPEADGLETPDYSCNVVFETDAAGDWIGSRMTPVFGLSVQRRSGAVMRVIWSYTTPVGDTAPTSFEVYNGETLPLGGTPDSVDYTGDMQYQKDLSLVDGTSYYFGVKAVLTDSEDSDFGPIVGPVPADGTAPDVPTPTVSTTW